MEGLISRAAFGLVAGMFAKWIVPRNQSGGGDGFNAGSFATAIIGALMPLFEYRANNR